MTARVLSEARLLADFPELGRCVPEWNDEQVRERLVYSYRLIYRLGGPDVLILAVIHGSRQLPAEVRDRPI